MVEKTSKTKTLQGFSVPSLHPPIPIRISKDLLELLDAGEPLELSIDIDKESSPVLHMNGEKVELQKVGGGEIRDAIYQTDGKTMHFIGRFYSLIDRYHSLFVLTLGSDYRHINIRSCPR